MSPTGVSAYLALEKLAQLKGGETVVISAAAGGLGHILVQLCAEKGCKVIAICGSEAKVNMLKSLDACAQIINHRKENVDTILSNSLANKINVAIDSVGRNMFDSFLKNIAPKGKVIIIGLASELSDSKFEIVQGPRVYESIYWKGASVCCFMNHLYKDDHKDSRDILFKKYQQKKLTIKIDSTSFKGIESIGEASYYLLGGESCGKVVVEF